MVATETEKLKLIFDYDSALLIDKLNGQVLFEDYFYGDPACGMISKNNDWALVGGIHLTLWKPTDTIKYHSKRFAWVYDMRIKNPSTIEILTDPWFEYSSIWELNIFTTDLKKIRNFTDYQGKPYTENVMWDF